MKSAVSIMAVSIIILSALAIADFSTADVDDTFSDDVFTYRIVSPTEVEIIEFDEGYSDADLYIPAVANDGTADYNVTGMNAQIYNDEITTIHIPASIRSIRDGCFSIDGLESFDVDPLNTYFESIDDVLYEKRNGVPNKLVKYPTCKPGEIFDTMPANVSEICASAFSASDLRVIELNDGIIKIGSAAFYNCTSLETVRSSLGDNVLPSSVSIIGSSAFSNCEKLSSLILSENLEYIGAYAFSNCGFTNLNITMLIEYIGPGTFSDCTKLERFTSNNFTYIVEDGVLYKTEKDGSREVFAYPCAKSDKTTYEMPDDVTDIESYAFSGCSKLQTIVLNDHMMNIPDTAFFDCKSLETIDLKNVATVGIASFNGCINMRSLELGKNLISIGDAAFYRCGIESLVIPANVLYIGSDAFGSCENLKHVTIEEGSKATLESDVFIYDRQIEKITIESSDVILEENALSISAYEDPFTLNVEVVKGYEVPGNATNEYTELNITIIGERPYPWENWIGVFFCALVIIGILYGMREV